jgi:hypothetical protein
MKLVRWKAAIASADEMRLGIFWAIEPFILLYQEEIISFVPNANVRCGR